MTVSWQNVEERIRHLAGFIWDRPAGPEHIGGVDIDCVVHVSKQQIALIEITEERTLEKVRQDILKLETARNALWSAEKVATNCYCVINGSVTRSMKSTGDDLKITVLSAEQFSRLYFDFESYKVGRLRRPFGSSVNPITGASDDSKYVPVSYLLEGTDKSYTADDVVSAIRDGRKIILLGEYGSGKSRCSKELFLRLSLAIPEHGNWPLAIDLRETWGLRRASEIVRRHFDELGLERGANNVIKAFGGDSFVYLLDGFDEVGSQSWSDDEARLRNIRNQSLAGVRDIISKSAAGMIICGREHYFNTDAEMFEALGLRPEKTILLRSKPEFSDEEMEEFLAEKSEDLVLPEWLPKRPLICQVIEKLPDEQLKRMFSDVGGDVEFWNHFMDVLCTRDAAINPIFEPTTLKNVMIRLSRYTRTKPSNVGPLSLHEIQRAFEEVVGEAPVDQAAMLQRLPALGRVQAETNDRRFIDVYILDGLRALDVDLCASNEGQNLQGMAWQNPLDQLGQRVLASKMQQSGGTRRYLALSNKCASDKNRVGGGDIVASLLRMAVPEVNFEGLALDDSHFLSIDFSDVKARKLSLSNCTFGSVTLLRDIQDVGLQVINSLAERVYGVAKAEGLPSWIKTINVDRFESLDNVAEIRRIKLSPAHQILVTIVRKTFFQKGTGRKEEALLRGLGNIGSHGTASRIINLLMHEGIISSFKGSEGTVYAPIRKNAQRMNKMLAALNLSDDSIWRRVGEL
jgi:hypothetical protein